MTNLQDFKHVNLANFVTHTIDHPTRGQIEFNVQLPNVTGLIELIAPREGNNRKMVFRTLCGLQGTKPQEVYKQVRYNVEKKSWSFNAVKDYASELRQVRKLLIDR